MFKLRAMSVVRFHVMLMIMRWSPIADPVCDPQCVDLSTVMCIRK